MGSEQNKVRNRLGFINHKTYNDFIEKYPKSDVTYEQYIRVTKESTSVIRDFILDNELGFKLPHNLGYIAVDKFKPSKDSLYIDWKNTRLLGKIIPFTNFHSLGYVFKIKLYKNSKIQPLKAYEMNTHRILKRMLAKKVKEGKQYIHIDRSYFNKRFSIDRFLNRHNNG